jgi:hypothetical protein
VVVVMENHSYADIIGNPTAPFINELAGRVALFICSSAITYPSEPNYLALISRSTKEVTDDGCPNRFTAPNLAAAALGVLHDPEPVPRHARLQRRNRRCLAGPSPLLERCGPGQHCRTPGAQSLRRPSRCAGIRRLHCRGPIDFQFLSRSHLGVPDPNGKFISDANEISGSPKGSQRRQTPGDTVGAPLTSIPHRTSQR